MFKKLFILFLVALMPLSSINANVFDNKTSYSDTNEAIAGFTSFTLSTIGVIYLIGISPPKPIKKIDSIQQNEIQSVPKTRFEQISDDLSGQIVTFKKDFQFNLHLLDEVLRLKNIAYDGFIYPEEVYEKFNLNDFDVITVETRITNDLEYIKNDMAKSQYAKNLYIKLKTLNISKDVLDRIFEFENGRRIE